MRYSTDMIQIFIHLINFVQILLIRCIEIYEKRSKIYADSAEHKFLNVLQKQMGRFPVEP